VEKLDFSDFWRFVVSAGVALVVGAVAALWLFLREPFDLLIPAEALFKLTPLAQGVITSRQAVVAQVIHWLPWGCLAVFAVGAVMITFGVARWLPLQALFERERRLQVERLDLELKAMSGADLITAAKAEVAEQVVAVHRPITQPTTAVAESDQLIEATIEPDEYQAAVDQYLAAERALVDSLARAVPPGFDVLPHRRLGTHTFDAVIVSRDQSQPDYVVEVKRVLRDAPYEPSRLRTALTAIGNLADYYTQALVRRSIPLLLVVVDREDVKRILDPINMRKLRQELISYGPRTLVRFMTPDIAARLTRDKVGNLLNANAQVIGFAS
jgi:hypothetical protein